MGIRFVTASNILFIILFLVSRANCQPVQSSQPLRTFTSPERGAELFGWSIALEGSRLYVGDPDDDTFGLERGSVHGFELGTGAHLFTAVAPGNYGRLGYDIDVIDGKVVAGALNKTIAVSEDGAAYVFDGATGSQLHRLDNPSPSFGAHFGVSVNTVFGKIIVGGPEDSSSGTHSSGIAHEFDDISGARTRTFTPPVSDVKDRGTFGFDAAEWTDSRILIAAPGNRKVYAFDSLSGGIDSIFSPTDQVQPVSWGQTLAVAGNDVLVGDPLSRLNGDLIGAVHVLDGNSGELLRSLQSPSPTRSGYFGLSIDTAGDLVLIGAPFESAVGAAYLFRLSTGELLQSFESPSPRIDDGFGYDVNLHDGYAFISAPSPVSDIHGGRVFMYAIVPEANAGLMAGTSLACALVASAIRHRRVD